MNREHPLELRQPRLVAAQPRPQGVCVRRAASRDLGSRLGEDEL
jgi:hypothetical protein